MEEWKAIDHAPGYEVSSLGRVRSYRANKGRTVKILKNKKMSKNKKYLFVQLRVCVDGRIVYQHNSIHRLVATYFLGNPKNLREVNHKDGNKQNNCVENLEWVSSRENKIHALKNNITKIHNSKLTDEQVSEIKKILLNKKNYCRPFLSDIASMFGVSKQTIKDIRQGRINDWR